MDDDGDSTGDGAAERMGEEEARGLVVALLTSAGLDPPADEVERLAALYPGLRRTIDRYHSIDVGDEVTAAVFRAAEATDGRRPADGGEAR
jgi:hypothetical protein